MTDTTKRIPHSECIQGRCADITTGCWGECSIRAAFPLNNVACGDAVTLQAAPEAPTERARIDSKGVFTFPVKESGASPAATKASASPDMAEIRGMLEDWAARWTPKTPHPAMLDRILAELERRAPAPSREAAPQAAAEDAVTVPRPTLELIDEAMNHMGDALNNMDAVEEEDEEKCTPAFDAIRELLAHPGEAPAGEKGQA